MHASIQAHVRAVGRQFGGSEGTTTAAVGRHFGGGEDTTTAVRVPIEVPGVGDGGEGRTWLSFRGPGGTPARPAQEYTSN